MSKRAAAGRRVGFFKRLVDVSEVEAEDDRVVERRLEKSWRMEFIGWRGSWREGRGRLVAAAPSIISVQYIIPRLF